MSKIVILPHQDLCPDGAVLEVNSDETISDTALRDGIEIKHTCGKFCACIVCHCIVREGSGSLPEGPEQKDDMLDKTWGLGPGSRLSCQARVTDEDLVVEIPRYAINRVREHQQRLIWDLSGSIAAKLAKHCTVYAPILIQKRFDLPIYISGFTIWKISATTRRYSARKFLE